MGHFKCSNGHEFEAKAFLRARCRECLEMCRNQSAGQPKVERPEEGSRKLQTGLVTSRTRTGASPSSGEPQPLRDSESSSLPEASTPSSSSDPEPSHSHSTQEQKKEKTTLSASEKKSPQKKSPSAKAVTSASPQSTPRQSKPSHAKGSPSIGKKGGSQATRKEVPNPPKGAQRPPVNAFARMVNLGLGRRSK